ncbi:unnamed protein product [Acanthoscelides obtectus]|uniref:Secreted protein n=1 Tax=Acanthoscelides obtectus TaxID=200917 RepID=A0A9P0LJV6_ACAOB|nr:unnamed protein product [Acanthoscelides obtectus]CAK1664355.1 hypothetical protein AOBTE_LOCUS24216 [Acanthoscelides obtectus]
MFLNQSALLALTYIVLEIHSNLAKNSVGLGGRSKETVNGKWDKLSSDMSEYSWIWSYKKWTILEKGEFMLHFVIHR